MKHHSGTFSKIFAVRPLVLIGLLVLFPRSGNTQTDADGFVQFEFNFNTPGARAVGMGGAFISIADDATAAEANPAGLTALLTRELSFEAKLIRYRREIALFAHRGTFDSFEVVSKDFYNNVVSPAFISLVWPVWNRITLSAFRHELVNFESAFFPPEATCLLFITVNCFYRCSPTWIFWSRIGAAPSALNCTTPYQSERRSDSLMLTSTFGRRFTGWRCSTTERVKARRSSATPRRICFTASEFSSNPQIGWRLAPFLSIDQSFMS